MASVPSDTPLRFSHFELHLSERVLRVRGAPVVVGSRAFDLLVALAQRHDRLVTKQELLDLVWPGLVVEEHNIATQISTLRRLLGANAIATLPGYGYRLTAARAAAEFHATAESAAPLCHNLPEARTRFIGREGALADLAGLLPAARLLTLTGVGGSGKTRLALQFAQQQREVFADGVWFVDLAPLTDAQRVAATCAAALGVREEGDTSVVEPLLRYLATRHTLLVLDNCEHVIEGVITLVDAILAGGGNTTILATSREGLGVSGEQIYPVRSLTLPATADLTAVQQAESTRVFADRAQLMLPEFDIDAGNAAAIAEICRRLDGIALAIELAAARVTMLPPAEIAARLDDRFRLLTGGSHALPRQQTLHAAMQWSYDLLAPAEQRMLRQMAVFAGGWTLPAAAAVAQTADEYEALALLTALHDKSLLAVDRAATGGQPRYRMLETVRQYALARLSECGEGESARSRHAAYFIAMAEEADLHVRGPDQDVWMGHFKQEHENLVVAFGWCREGGVDPHWGLRLAAATGYYWGWNSVELGLRLTQTALDHDGAAASTPAREGALRALSRMKQFCGRYQEANSLAQQALAVARQLGEPRRVAWALNSVGSTCGSLGRLEDALQIDLEALALARELGDGNLIFTLLNNIGAMKHRAGELEAAERYYREGVDWARRHAGRVGNVVLLDNLVRVLVARGAPQQARQFAMECLPLARGEKVSADLLDAVAGLASCLGEHALAARFWAVADQQLHAWGYRHEPLELRHIAPLLANSRRAIGDAAFEAADAAGRALKFEQAMLELEQWLQPPAQSAHPA